MDNNKTILDKQNGEQLDHWDKKWIGFEYIWTNKIDRSRARWENSFEKNGHGLDHLDKNGLVLESFGINRQE